ncbi:hypothetical protein D8B26_005043 [Coccidioides posadasii str. Silveira]|uniref:uncharacterized protein n=1 Tax=Coccidioides posadasii (strain RMSCC 757 / Silveira) TaxID=443226 RepID=UPI001BEF7C80|nr:hypothetical protein D8B26_005043 [Coccidioides posadasii str. Silveira]
MASLTVTGKARTCFVEAAVLLHALGPVRGEPASQALDHSELGQDREGFLRRKFLDSFAPISCKGGDSVSAACMEDPQPEGTVVRIASNGSVSADILSQAQSIINDLSSIACGGLLSNPALCYSRTDFGSESTRLEKEADILLKIVKMDISRLRIYVDDLRVYQNMILRPRSEVQ